MLYVARERLPTYRLHSTNLLSIRRFQNNVPTKDTAAHSVMDSSVLQEKFGKGIDIQVNAKVLPVATPQSTINVPRALGVVESLRIWLAGLMPNSLVAFQNEFIHESLGKSQYKVVGSNSKNITLEKVDNPSIKVQSLQVPIYDHTEHINEVCFENMETADAKALPTNLVMLHGFGAGLGCYHRNFKGLLESNRNVKIHALDWLGFGGSSNPKIELSTKYVKPPHLETVNYEDPMMTKVHNKYYRLIKGYKLHYNSPLHGRQYVESTAAVLQDIENYYIDALEAWRKERNLGKICLMGHSYGGYLSSAYAMKYPENIEKLLLVSPVGIEKNPLSIQNPALLAPPLSRNTTAELKPTLNPKEFGFLGRFPIMPPWFVNIWNNNLSLLTLIRLVGPLGPRMLSQYTMSKSRRGASNLLQILQLNQYSYNLFKTKSTSETAITKLLNGAVMAKNPLFGRLDKMAKISNIYWIYGEFDWMNGEAGAMIANEINTMNGGGKNEFYKVSKAGHNLYMDNPEEFNGLVKKILEE
ncbi:hypothetical protein BABINDRAFT_159840 [Babjeviella inositovora NRRL Y-12698]|uniref:AB hydrolase-1 domain-containing protein n=1 Tax=Babjeviella inositovora NRRL Y-12698 TaxID=984486 RepID=A0A1E3QV72_9ASCO|nr:uncharacterized protein BABINDRAFT_159840 [Babjeviella inositovora NRRL Y-12698]ODQ81565.1 hypothetical protein BABINDRAFT_159840 [Babjeviella inositovora NRRL Y-12698]